MVTNLAEKENALFQICRILPTGVFAQRRLLCIGDCLVSFNGHDLEGVTKEECASILRQDTEDVHMEVLRKGSMSDERSIQPRRSGSYSASNNEEDSEAESVGSNKRFVAEEENGMLDRGKKFMLFQEFKDLSPKNRPRMERNEGRTFGEEDETEMGRSEEERWLNSEPRSWREDQSANTRSYFVNRTMQNLSQELVSEEELKLFDEKSFHDASLAPDQSNFSPNENGTEQLESMLEFRKPRKSRSNASSVSDWRQLSSESLGYELLSDASESGHNDDTLPQTDVPNTLELTLSSSSHKIAPQKRTSLESDNGRTALQKPASFESDDGRKSTQVSIRTRSYIQSPGSDIHSTQTINGEETPISDRERSVLMILPPNDLVSLPSGVDKLKDFSLASSSPPPLPKVSPPHSVHSLSITDFESLPPEASPNVSEVTAEESDEFEAGLGLPSVVAESSEKSWDWSNHIGAGDTMMLVPSPLHPTRNTSSLPRKRTEGKPFQIDVLQSLTGLGIEVSVKPEGVVIDAIQKSGPVGRNPNVR